MSDTGRSLPPLSGAVRVDERIPRLCARLEPGEIAVIDFPDLDRSSALSLLSQRPLAVLNVASSTTGRKSSLGARLLIDAGVTVVDDMGSDLMSLAEGETIEVRGGEVYRAGELVAAGKRRSLQELLEQEVDGRERLESGIHTFAQGASLAWQNEAALLLDNAGVPDIPALTVDQKHPRPTLVVAQGEQTARQLRRLRRFVRDFSPSIIAVSEAANQVSLLGRKPDVIVGDPSNIKEKILRGGAQIILLERPDGTVPGAERPTNLGLNFQTLSTSASATDAAVLLADAGGAPQIITVGGHSGIAEFLDRSSAEATVGFFTSIRCQEKLVSADVAGRLYRPGISSWQLVILVLAALVVMGVAVFFTPWGGALGFGVVDWFGGASGLSSSVSGPPGAFTI